MKPRICMAFGLALVAGSAWAHHSTPLYFDYTVKRVTLTGTLTRVDWRNPHIEFSLEAKGDNGHAEAWSIESGPPNSFVKRKASKADFQQAIGHSVTMEVSPARDGSRYGILWKITFPDGRVVVIRGE